MASSGVVFLYGTGQAKGPFLDEIEEIQPFALITLGEVDDEPKIGGDHLIFGSLPTANHCFFLIAVFA